MPKSAVNRLQYQIDQSEHDTESIGIYIDKRNKATYERQLASRNANSIPIVPSSAERHRT
jgi:hypothetical protein